MPTVDGVIVQERTARKQHDCYWCPDGIKPGERYERQAAPPNSWLGNTQWWVLRAHTQDNYQCLASSGRL